jgi:hypothetical protein
MDGSGLKPGIIGFWKALATIEIVATTIARHVFREREPILTRGGETGRQKSMFARRQNLLEPYHGI